MNENEIKEQTSNLFTHKQKVLKYIFRWEKQKEWERQEEIACFDFWALFLKCNYKKIIISLD